MANSSSISTSTQAGQSFGGDKSVAVEAARQGSARTQKERTSKAKQHGGIPDSALRIYDSTKAPFKKAAPGINVNGTWVAFEPVKTFVEMILNFAEGLDGKNYVAPEY